MRCLYSWLIISVVVNGVFAAEEKTEHSVIEYIQELTGKIDALAQKIEALERRIEIVEIASNARGIEEKSRICEKVPETSCAANIKPERSMSSVSADELWSSGNTALQNKNFAEAEELFQNLVNNYPKHANAAEANYWLGEIQLMHKKHAQAQAYYALAYKAFPITNSRKTDVGLKIAECYFALNKNKEGCLFLKEIMKLQQSGGAVSTATQKLMEQYWKTYNCSGN